MYVPDDLFHAWSVNRPGISYSTDEVVVAVDKESVNGWETQDETTIHLETAAGTVDGWLGVS